jgi:hypothetical protein
VRGVRGVRGVGGPCCDIITTYAPPKEKNSGNKNNKKKIYNGLRGKILTKTSWA